MTTEIAKLAGEIALGNVPQLPLDKSYAPDNALTRALAAPKSAHYSDGLAAAQGTAAAHGFNHVSASWYPKTLSYEEGLELMEGDRALREDLNCQLDEMVPTVNNAGEFVMQYNPRGGVDGRQFKPTAHCIGQIGTKWKTGTTYPQMLLANQYKGDGAMLAKVIDHGRRCFAKDLMDNHKAGGRMCGNFLWRTRQDGELRAYMTEQYNIIPNEWYLGVIAEAIPGGRLSHWRGDSDTLWGNVLIPDTIRQESDSQYGAMFSLSACEIGRRSLQQRPSVFRFICMNGCIHGQERGDAFFKVVHRGQLKLSDLKAQIINNIESQIPLLPAGIERLLASRGIKSDVGVKPLVAQVAHSFKMTKAQASATLVGYIEEDRVSPETRGTLFHLINAITRAGQGFSNQEWYQLDNIGGQLMDYSLNDWDSLTGRAKLLKAKVVDDSFSMAS